MCGTSQCREYAGGRGIVFAPLPPGVRPVRIAILAALGTLVLAYFLPFAGCVALALVVGGAPPQVRNALLVALVVVASGYSLNLAVRLGFSPGRSEFSNVPPREPAEHVQPNEPSSGWQRHALPKGGCSAEFPFPVMPTFDSLGLVSLLSSPSCGLGTVEVPKELQYESNADTFCALVAGAPGTDDNPNEHRSLQLRMASGVCWGELKIERIGANGRFRPAEYVLFTVRDSTLYCAFVESKNEIDEALVRRFFDSVRLE